MNNPKEMGFFYENCYFSHFHNIPMKVMRNIVMANYFFFISAQCLPGTISGKSSYSGGWGPARSFCRSPS